SPAVSNPGCPFNISPPPEKLATVPLTPSSKIRSSPKTLPPSSTSKAQTPSCPKTCPNGSGCPKTTPTLLRRGFGTHLLGQFWDTFGTVLGQFWDSVPRGTNPPKN